MDNEPTKYVCTVDDLDLLLGEPLKGQFQGLFSNSWRLNYKGLTPNAFLNQFGIDFDNPTVRDAVAFDLVKLDDDSVSNDRVYTFDEHVGYSPMEYERYLLHRNYRINLVNLDPDWSNITYAKKETQVDGEVMPTKRRTVDRVYQGAKLSKTLLEYLSQVMARGTDGYEIYRPFTNGNDFSTEVSLIPNTHPDFRSITSRAYYDSQYVQYKRLCNKYGFSNIATFALVDPKKDKNHTGEYLVKIQRDNGDGTYKYVCATIDSKGQFVTEPEYWTSNVNSILCVCEDDFYNNDRVVHDLDNLQDSDYWHPEELDDEGNPKGIRDIPMVHSTTSSHYSIFRQRVPDYDLKLVRHYLQFKNRLEGMELCLEELRRNVHHKEVRSSECFTKLTMVLNRLMQEFVGKKDLMALVAEYCNLLAEWDRLTTKKIQVLELKDAKLDALKKLQ